MNKTDFTAASPGRLIENLGGQLTYVPAALPPAIALPMHLLKRAEETANALGRLDGFASGMPDQQILIRSFVRREAQLSSYIEGIHTTYDRIADAQRPGAKASVEYEVRETVNAERAILAGVQAVFEEGRPITLGLIRQLHGLLLDDVRGHESRGRFRDVQVYIGSGDQAIEAARYVPPPPHLLLESMEQFIAYLGANDSLPALVQIAMLHYQFEAIHPFGDGNGRLGRLLILLGLCQHKLLTTPLLNASLHFERNRRHYYDALMAVSTHGEWAGWIAFFIDGIGVAVDESTAKLRELGELRRRYHDQIVAARGPATMLKLVDHLFILPALTISDAAEIMGITYEAARLNVHKLVEAKILRVRKAGTPTTYVADVILKAVNAEPTRR